MGGEGGEEGWGIRGRGKRRKEVKKRHEQYSSLEKYY